MQPTKAVCLLIRPFIFSSQGPSFIVLNQIVMNENLSTSYAIHEASCSMDAQYRLGILQSARVLKAFRFTKPQQYRPLDFKKLCTEVEIRAGSSYSTKLNKKYLPCLHRPREQQQHRLLIAI